MTRIQLRMETPVSFFMKIFTQMRNYDGEITYRTKNT